MQSLPSTYWRYTHLEITEFQDVFQSRLLVCWECRWFRKKPSTVFFYCMLLINTHLECSTRKTTFPIKVAICRSHKKVAGCLSRSGWFRWRRSTWQCRNSAFQVTLTQPGVHMSQHVMKPIPLKQRTCKQKCSKHHMVEHVGQESLVLTWILKLNKTQAPTESHVSSLRAFPPGHHWTIGTTSKCDSTKSWYGHGLKVFQLPGRSTMGRSTMGSRQFSENVFWAMFFWSIWSNYELS